MLINNKRVRVLQNIPKLATGGAERLVLDLAKHLDSKVFEVVIVSLYPFTGEPFELEAKAEEISVTYLSKQLGFDPRVCNEMHRLVQDYRPDVVHNHLHGLYTVLPACLWHDVPIRLHTLHSVAEGEANGSWRALQRIAFRNLRFVPVSISKVVHDTVQKIYGPIESPIIFNGVDTKRYLKPSVNREEWRRQNNISKYAPIFVNVARLAPEKNHKLLIRAFGEVAQSLPAAILLIVGDGQLRTELVSIVTDLGLHESVRFLGIRTDITDILNASDTFVLSSNWEGLPLTVLEAMSASKPVIGTAVGGVSELISNEDNGLLVPPRAPEALAAAMLELARNPAKGLLMGKRGLEIVKRRFEVREMARQYGELYVRLLANSP
jgi:glycosyltransferase involved in cell wall biosynthesis